jgi:hypothetical protein
MISIIVGSHENQALSHILSDVSPFQTREKMERAMVNIEIEDKDQEEKLNMDMDISNKTLQHEKLKNIGMMALYRFFVSTCKGNNGLVGGKNHVVLDFSRKCAIPRGAFAKDKSEFVQVVLLSMKPVPGGPMAEFRTMLVEESKPCMKNLVVGIARVVRGQIVDVRYSLCGMCLLPITHYSCLDGDYTPLNIGRNAPLLQTASLLLLSRAMGVSHTVLVWLPATHNFGLVQSGALVLELNAFCSDPLSPTTDSIKNTKKRNLCLLRNREMVSNIDSLSVTWNKAQCPKELYCLIQTSSWDSETYNIHYSRKMDTAGYTRLHEISEKIGLDGVVSVINLETTLPGKRYHLLLAGYFVACPEDPACAKFITIKSEIILRFNDAAIVSRLVDRHGNKDKKKIFRIEKMDGRWLLKGLHPLVPTLDPNPRPFSFHHSRLEEERTPNVKVARETLSLIPDAIEMLHKASTSSSTLASTGPKAEIGKCSIKTSFLSDTMSNQHTSFKNEMKSNALIMDQGRYLQHCSLLFVHVLSKVHLALPSLGNSNFLKVDSRFKKDKSMEVCVLPLIFHTLVHIV